MIRVVLDSNVVISALVFGGKPRRILNLILEGRLELHISKEILDEILEILALKFNYPEDALFAVETEVKSMAILAKPDFRINRIQDDDDDNRILECGKAGRCHYILTGDRHLLSVGKFDNIEIKTVADFLSLIDQPS